MSALADREVDLGFDFHAHIPCQTVHAKCATPAVGVLSWKCCGMKFNLCLAHYEKWKTAMAEMRARTRFIQCARCHARGPINIPTWRVL